MFQNKSHPPISSAEEVEEDASPNRRGKSEWRKADDSICQAVAELLVKEAVDPIRKLRKQLKDLRKDIAELREKVPSGDYSRIDVVAALAKRRHNDLEDLVAKLEKQVETATAFPFRYRGVWRQGPYCTNESVTFKGCLWIALVSTETKPGESRHWQLAVKAGRDGKDAPKR